MLIDITPLKTTVLNSSGNGDICMSPPLGTKWRLRSASVLTSSVNVQPLVVLSRGSASGPLTEIDRTYVGGSGLSGRVANQVFHHGDCLWAEWSGGDANAVATLQLFGQQADRTDSFGVPYPITDGFAPTVLPITLPHLTELLSTDTVVFGTPTDLAVIDMRAWASYVMVVESVGPSPATNWDPLTVMCEWHSESPASLPIYCESFAFWSQPSGGTVFIGPGGRLQVQDAVLGQFFSIRLNNGGPDDLAVSFRLYGTDRVLARRVSESDVSNALATNNAGLFLMDSGGLVVSGAGVATRYASRLHIGRVTVQARVVTTDHTFQFFDTEARQIDQYTVTAAGAVDRKEMVWPNFAVRLTVTNTGGVNGSHRITVIGQREPV